MMKQSKGGKKAKAKYTRQELAKLREYGELDPLNSKGEFGGLDEAITNAFSKKMTNMVGTFTVGEKKRKISKRAKESGQLIKHEVADDKSIDEIDYREFTKKKKKNSKDKLKKLIELIGNDESEIEVQRENLSAVGENGTINGSSHDSEKKSARKKKNNSVLGFGDVITEDSKEESEVEEEPDKINDESNGISTENDPFVKRTSYLEAEISKCLTLTDSKGDNILEPITFQDKELNVVMDYIPQHSKVQETFKEIISTKSKKLSSYQVKTRLVNNFSSMNASAVGKEDATDLQLSLFKIMNTYKDVVYGNRTYKNSKQIMTTYALHILNHLLKSRDRIIRNNARILKSEKEGKPIDEKVIKDQGFNRPTVLILFPYRNMAYNFIKILIKLIGMNKVLNIERFEQEFDDPEKTTNAGKPEEYQEIFAGNIDDSFRLGVRLNMNKGLCLYSEFYNSDIIVASPLGLKLASENSSGSKGAGTSKSGSEYDYLSSIEVLVMDQCDAFLMQNWEHVLSILQKINNVPKKIHPSTDFSRVQSYFLDANSKYFRQNLLFTDYFTPEILSIFNSTCENINGKYKVASLYSTTNSSINHVTTKPLPQVFYKIPSPLVSGSDPEKQVMPTDQRFNYFCQNFSKLLFVPGTFVFVSSYFDYVRVRNYINHITENPSSVFKRFVSREELIKSPAFLNEYTSKSNVSRFRSHFFHGNSSVMLYSERFHYYYRYKIRGIKQIIFYSLPEHPQYYPEIVNLLESDTTSNLSLSTPRCHVLFDTLDSLRLERIIGSSETSNILSSFQSKFTFV